MAIENKINYEVKELQCYFQGEGLYRFEGPISTRTLTMDRLTFNSFLLIPNNAKLQKVKITTGLKDTCDIVKAPPHIPVYIDNRLCVSNY